VTYRQTVALRDLGLGFLNSVLSWPIPSHLCCTPPKNPKSRLAPLFLALTSTKYLIFKSLLYFPISLKFKPDFNSHSSALPHSSPLLPLDATIPVTQHLTSARRCCAPTPHTSHCSRVLQHSLLHSTHSSIPLK